MIVEGAYAGTDYESESVVAEYLAFHYPHEDALRALLGPAAPAEAERYPFALRSFWTGGADAVALDVQYFRRTKLLGGARGIRNGEWMMSFS